MGNCRIELMTGGASCGKSTFAEKRMMDLAKPYYYIATMLPYGKEAEERIRRHREMRTGKGFYTIECGFDLEKLRLPARGSVLLECMATLLANEMFENGKRADNAIESCYLGALNLASQSEALVIVSNEVGSDGITYPPETMEYVRALGTLNCRLASKANAVYELSASVPRCLKNK